MPIDVTTLLRGLSSGATGYLQGRTEAQDRSRQRSMEDAQIEQDKADRARDEADRQAAMKRQAREDAMSAEEHALRMQALQRDLATPEPAPTPFQVQQGPFRGEYSTQEEALAAMATLPPERDPRAAENEQGRMDDIAQAIARAQTPMEQDRVARTFGYRNAADFMQAQMRRRGQIGPLAGGYQTGEPTVTPPTAGGQFDLSDPLTSEALRVMQMSR